MHKIVAKTGIAAAVWVAQAFGQVFAWDADFRREVDDSVGVYSDEEKAQLQCSSFDLLSASGQFMMNPLRSDAVLLYFPVSDQACKDGRSPIAYLLGSDLVPYAWAQASWNGNTWKLLKLPK